jgi:hypothetical protein
VQGYVERTIQRHLVFAQIVVLAVAMTAVVAGCGARQAVTTTAPKPPATFTKRDVTRAFARVGLKLRNASGNYFVVVTMLTTAQSHPRWSVTAYVYSTANQANAAFSQDVGEWSASGIESVQVKNVVVVVVPSGHLLIRHAHFFAMPKLIYTALGFLDNPA